MFKKVLIAEDHELVSSSIQKTLSDLKISHDIKDYVYYCDDAFNRIKKAAGDGNPYELLITDLSFDEDIKQDIKNGVELIKAAREFQPNLKVMVFSIENRASVAQSLFKDLKIDAYVPKARHDAHDLKLALESVSIGKSYLSPNLRQVNRNVFHDFTELDLAIISLLKDGKSQIEISNILKDRKMKSSSLSSIEKRLNIMRLTFEVTSNTQLITELQNVKTI
ncbi:two-component system capsular synthesis response regulator RcsB [Pedobacter sp. UYP24]